MISVKQHNANKPIPLVDSRGGQEKKMAITKEVIQDKIEVVGEFNTFKCELLLLLKKMV